MAERFCQHQCKGRNATGSRHGAAQLPARWAVTAVLGVGECGGWAGTSSTALISYRATSGLAVRQLQLPTVLRCPPSQGPNSPAQNEHPADRRVPSFTMRAHPKDYSAA